MPKLLLFSPCLKVLIDQENNVSLISIFQELKVPVAENIPPNAQAAMRWDTLSLWLKIPSDEGRTFEQDEMLIAPDGTMVSHTKQQFSMATRIQRNLTTVFGFPVGQVGEYSLEMKLKDMANEGVFIFETSFPLTVGHLATAQSGNT